MLDNYIIIILIVAVLYILYLYFRCKRLEKRLHDAAIIVSAHKTVLINKVIRYTNSKDAREVARQLDEEIASCCKFMIEHEEELIKRSDEDGFINDNKEDK